MRFVIQRVTESSVKVDGKVIGQIGKGFMVLIGVADSDTNFLSEYILHLGFLRLHSHLLIEMSRTVIAFPYIQC